MGNLLVNKQDQLFVLDEMLKIKSLFDTAPYSHISETVMEAAISEASNLAVKESYPIFAQADHEGCRLENGEVKVPACFHQLKKHFDQIELAAAFISKENGGHGFPMSLWAAMCEHFAHNLSFFWTWASPFSATQVIALAGTQAQKDLYLPHLISGRWGSALSANEEDSGSDFTMQKAVATPQPDGSYHIRGRKNHVTCGDSDMFENMIHVVIARVEGDPAEALSTFIVSKFHVNSDGSLGSRNDCRVAELERKLGLKASPTCHMIFGDTGVCRGELIGARGQAIPALFQLLKYGYGANGTIATGIASAAYLHALDYAQKRIQGTHIAEAENPEAQPVAIIAHPDVRRMLLWMKSHVEGMRSLVYYSWQCMDKAMSVSDPDERTKWSGLMDLLLPIARLFTADRGFKVTETAIQVHGRIGYFSDHPAQQFLRDIKPTSIWEACAGVHALLYVAQTMGQNDGRDFMNLITEMTQTIDAYKDLKDFEDLAGELQTRVNLLQKMGIYLAECVKSGKAILPISNATPLIQLIGDICLGWMLFWQAGIASEKLADMFIENSIDMNDSSGQNTFIGQNKKAAFYAGKIYSARFFIKNVLPQADAVAAAIQNEDLSLMSIHDHSF